MKLYEEYDWTKVAVLLGIQILWILILISLWYDHFDKALTYAVILIAWKLSGFKE